MKRGTLTVLLACAGLGAGCSDTQATTGFAGLSGTYDLTMVGDLVFVTSSDRDELQVLDLSKDPKQFIPAPNPLQTLAIPVLDRPDSLTRDVGYKADGSDHAGPYVYARSAGASQISVVAAGPDRLVQVLRLEGRSLITSFAARSPAPVPEGQTPGPGVLYYGIQDPDAPFEADTGGSRIERQWVPGPDALGAGEVVPAAVTLFCLQPGESVQAMAVLPNDQLVVATRQATGLTGRTLLVQDTHPETSVDCTTPSAAVRDLSGGFDNFPVRYLVTHPRVSIPDNSETPQNEAQVMEAGQFVFGIKDELSCGGATECTGVLAVDTLTGLTATDLSGAKMLPIRPPDGLPTGLALIPTATLRLRLVGPEGTITTDASATVPLLGLMPSSNGSITTFSASDRRQFDLDLRRANVVVEARNEQEQVITVGGASTLVDVSQAVEHLCDPSNPTGPSVTRRTLLEGSVVGGVFRFIYQGAFPSMVDLPRDLTTPTSFVVPQATEVSRQVRLDDTIVLANQDIRCTTDLKVTSIRPASEAGKVVLETTTPIPEDCAELPLFTVRVGGDQRFVLVNDLGEFLSRDVEDSGPGYQIPTSYYFHPADFTQTTTVPDSAIPCGTPGDITVPLFPPTPPPLTLRATATNALSRGDRFVVSVGSGVRNHISGVDTSSSSGAGLAFYTLPGPVVAAQSGGASLAYIAYPSADGILQLNLSVIIDNAVNAFGLSAFE
ncbi:hypothetical protein VZQ01_00495 [Myxococcus faecalis]|uniref:hypothetical protein n=1 Tax=Myxococcus faecalis TaxID=3115646 RepID=UPI003CE7779D